MTTTVVSGRVAILFDRITLPVAEQGDTTVDAYRCRWCGWMYVVDDPKLIPDHECRPPAARSEGGSRAQ